MEGLLRFAAIVGLLAVLFLVVFALIVPALGLDLWMVVASLGMAFLALIVWYLRRCCRD